MDNTEDGLNCASATCIALDAATRRRRRDMAPTIDNIDIDITHTHTQRGGINCSMRRSCQFIFITLCMVLWFAAPAQSCGPGRGLGRRKERNLYPLVLKQRVPNLSEYQLGASGPLEGEITRNMSKFKELVLNYNKDIIFKDEEGTGADRVMTKRCREKLNTLAFSVMNEWPSVRLLVTESWDEQHQHGHESLHYEGRAVTIGTSDRDPAKYGMLARLAVEAGFDWVFYISRRHIYCSVKSDASTISHVHGCFPPKSTALLESGKTKLLSELSIGDRVLTIGSNGQPTYSEVFLFMDRDLNQVENFVRLHTDNGAVLKVTPAHLVTVWRPDTGELTYIFADKVQEKDFVLVHDAVSNSLRPQRVIAVRTERLKGVVAPLTREGTIVVNSVAASCYAVIDSQSLAHWGLLPMRLWYTLRNSIQSIEGRTATSPEKPQIGIHWYAEALYKMKEYVVPMSWRHQ